MKILIADDELYARERLAGLISELGSPYQIAGEAANGTEAVAACRDAGVDLVLMDIRMPGKDGLQAAAELAALASPPAVIFVTAYEEHALDAFEQSAVDYLLKPIRRERLKRALDRAASLTRPQLQAIESMLQTEEPVYISASYRGGLQRIPLDQVIFFRADQKYVTARYIDGEVLLEESLKSLEEQYGQYFLRIHRNALVARQRLSGLSKEGDGRCLALLKGCDERLEVSRRHLAEVRRLLKGR